MHQLVRALLLLFVITASLQIAAMDESSSYPWYQVYKNPTLQAKVARRWQLAKKIGQTIKDFGIRHKDKLLGGLIGGTVITCMVWECHVAYKIHKAYDKYCISSDQFEKKDQYGLAAMGILAYTVGFDAKEFFNRMPARGSDVGKALAELAQDHAGKL